MNKWMLLCVLTFLFVPAMAQSLMVNLAPDRPAFNWTSDAGTISRFLEPGSRLTLESGILSVDGSAPIQVEPQGIYYWARWKGPDRLYQLAANQALVINATGSALSVRITGTSVAEGLLANASFALGGADESGSITVDWADQQGGAWTATLEGGRLYRLELGSPDGTGTQPILRTWDDSAR